MSSASGMYCWRQADCTALGCTVSCCSWPLTCTSMLHTPGPAVAAAAGAQGPAAAGAAAVGGPGVHGAAWPPQPPLLLQMLLLLLVVAAATTSSDQ
jgi:hypothetical protein